MTARLGALLRRMAPADEALIAEVVGSAVPRTCSRGTWLLRAGEVAEWAHVVERGLVRELYIDAEGTEHTRAFVAEGELTGSLLDLLSGQPAITHLEVLEPTTLSSFRLAHVDALCARRPELHRVVRRLVEEVAIRKMRREHALLVLSAAERHEQWLAEHAALDGRVSRKQLASYLGITAEHLSRLRRARAGR